MTGGLRQNGVEVVWATRPCRLGESVELDQAVCQPIYYRGDPRSAKTGTRRAKFGKAVSHLLSSIRLLRFAAERDCDIVHFQWLVLPLIDGALIRLLRRHRPVVVTAHDTRPFNGSPTSRGQMLGYDWAAKSASMIIVHSGSAAQALQRRGYDATRIRVLPHGPFEAPVAASPLPPVSDDGRWRVVFFGKIQPYKGVQDLVEALGRLERQERSRLSVVVAGEPLMPVEPLVERSRELGLTDTLEFRPHRQSEAEMAALFAGAQAFVLPYRQIDASGVLFMLLQLKRWIIATDLGAFSEHIEDGRNGTLVGVADPNGLAQALVSSIGAKVDLERVPELQGWNSIGAGTRDLYQTLIEAKGRS